MSGPRHLVLVSYEFPPVQGPGVWRALGFVRHLPALGWSVTVCCADRSHWHRRTDPDLLDAIPGGVAVHRVRGIPFGGFMQRVLPGVLLRRLRRIVPDPLLLPTLKLAVSAARHAPRHGEFVVLTSGPPHVVHLVGLLLKRMRRCTWVADYRDPWMDDPVQAWGGAYQRALGLRMERAVMRRADVVTVVSPSWQSHLQARRAHRPTVLIPNATDLAPDRLPPVERPWESDERVLLFPGTPQPGNSTTALWEGIARFLRDRRDPTPPVRFAFMGLHDDIHTLAIRLGITSAIEDLGPQPYRRATALMRGADGILVPVRMTDTSSGVVPAKIYDAMAVGKFIVLVGDPAGDAASLLQAWPWRAICPSDDADAVADALTRFARAQLPAPEAVPPPLWTRASIARDLHDVLDAFSAGRPIAGRVSWPAQTGAATPPPG